MSSVTRATDDLMCRGRILRRDWRPHLAKSTSLPDLALAPAYRPLFTCQRCGFSNVYIPLCLWCRWSSSEAAVAFEAATSHRRRRLSGPSRVTWKPPVSDLRREVQIPQGLATNFPSFGSLSGPKPPVAMNHLPVTVLAALPHPLPDWNPGITMTEKPHDTLDTHLPHKPYTLRIRRGLPAASLAVPPRYPTVSPSPSLHSEPMRKEIRHVTTHPISLPPIVSPTHSLRRKHHMTFPRQKSTRSLRSRPPAIAPPPQPVSVTSMARLGHPSRPYYTAIRPHLNSGGISPRPASPASPVSAPPTLTDVGSSLPSPPPGRPSFEFSRPRSSTTSGWSLSGEIELQIELSQRREEEGTVRSSGRRESIVRGVRKLGTGLRDLVLRRG